MSAWRDPWDRLPTEPWSEIEAGDRSPLLLAAIAIGTFVAIGALSLRQVTAPATSTRLLEAGIASTVDIDRYIADELPELQEWAGLPGSGSTDLPGFPIEVIVTAAEVKGDSSALRDMVLARSAAIVYDEGTGAFDRTGNQSIDLVSGETLLRILVDTANEANHSRATWVAVVAAAVLVASATLFVVPRGRRRLGALGGAVIAGALPGVMLAGLAHAIAGQYGAAADPYAGEVREIIRSAIGIPLRNFIVALGAGLAIIAIAILLRLAERLLQTSEVVSPDQE